MRYLLIVCIAFTVTLARAKDTSFSLDSIDAILSDIAPHAQDFPPRFASVAERKRVEADLRDVLTKLDAAVAKHPDDAELLFRVGYANAMGHNLDFEGCAFKYFKAFDHLLELKPDDKRANFYYGAFLAGTAARQKDSIKYLEKAIALGVTDAHYTLAFVYLSQSDKEKALFHIKEYARLNPDDESAKQKVAFIEQVGSVERKEGKPPGFDEMTKKEGPTSR